MKLAKRFTTGVAMSAMLLPTFAPYAAYAATTPTTPIQHVIIIVGENHTFDNLFGTYQPKAGQTFFNLPTKCLVRADGRPAPKLNLAKKKIGNERGGYDARTASPGFFPALPHPYPTSGIVLPRGAPDAPFPADLPNGPYQI